MVTVAKQADGHPANNMKVWSVDTAEQVTSFLRKNQEGWNLQFTYDEKYCAQSSANTIRFYESEDMSTGEFYFGNWGGALLTGDHDGNSLEHPISRGCN